MRCQYKSNVVILVGCLFLLLVLITCAFQDWELTNPQTEKRPQVVRENPKAIHNDMGLSIGDFCIYVGDKINNMESRGLRVYKVRPDMGRDVAGKYKIYTIWVYYD